MTTQRYVVFLRGLNVGGNSIVKMATLAEVLMAAGFTNVRTYIQSGNVLLASSLSEDQVRKSVEACIRDAFDVQTQAAVFTDQQWVRIVAAAPEWWGARDDWKHNILIMIPPHTAEEAAQPIGQVKPDIESLSVGEGVLYQSVSWAAFGKSVTGKLAASPVYKHMTVRNYNTAHKLALLCQG